jgi:UrcA family protein
MNRLSVTFAAVLSAAVLSVGALAASVRVEAPAPLASSRLYEVRAVSVSFDDLDVASHKGAAALYRRIEAASHVVCSERLAQGVSYELERQYAECRALAVSSAVASMNTPRLTEVAAATR